MFTQLLNQMKQNIYIYYIHNNKKVCHIALAQEEKKTKQAQKNYVMQSNVTMY